MNFNIPVTIVILHISLLMTAQTAPAPEMIRDIQRNVCAIKITNESGGGATVGCGVILMMKIDGQNTYFIATASHIVEPLFGDNNAVAEIMAFDKSGVMLKTSVVGKNHVVWRNEEVDAALVALPRNMKPEGQVPADYITTGPANLKVIGEPDWGQEIYLFGYRWLNEDLFVDILKKGILSVGTTQLPGYEGHLVYLIDNMANRGMSGGLAFTAEGTGIGIISSYVYETNSRLEKSDDLTVCLPLTFFFKALEHEIATGRETIRQIND